MKYTLFVFVSTLLLVGCLDNKASNKTVWLMQGRMDFMSDTAISDFKGMPTSVKSYYFPPYSAKDSIKGFYFYSGVFGRKKTIFDYYTLLILVCNEDAQAKRF